MGRVGAEREEVLVAPLMGLLGGSLKELTKAKAGRGDSPSYVGRQAGMVEASFGGHLLRTEGPCSIGLVFLEPHIPRGRCLGAVGSLQQSKVIKSANKSPQASSNLGLEENPLGSNPGSAVN